MKKLRQFGSFWYHFIVGDDWRIAVSVIIGLAITAFINHEAQTQFWWLLPIMVIVALTTSLWLATRKQ